MATTQAVTHKELPLSKTVKVAVYRAEIDRLFRLANVDYHACVGVHELNNWQATARRVLAEIEGCECKRSTPFDLERFARAVEAVQDRLTASIKRIETLKPNRDMDSIATQVLTDCGWTSCSGAAIVLKSFETAVGLKEAHAYLSKGDEFNRTLSGDYQSEGRNALESSCVLIPVGADAGTVRRLAQQFAKQVDAAVAQTYAARLHQSACNVA